MTSAVLEQESGQAVLTAYATASDNARTTDAPIGLHDLLSASDVTLAMAGRQYLLGQKTGDNTTTISPAALAALRGISR